MTTRGGDWSWSFYGIWPGEERADTLDKAEWVEKNYPRLSAGGVLVWSARDEQGAEWLIERDPKGQTRRVEAAGAGARWPSYAGHDRWLVWTEVDHRVEYWLLNNPHASDSPLSKLSGPVSAVLEEPPRRPGMCSSPRDLHRR
jgi:hypothetical protein